jgi:uncharacterized Fe-S radical SAM superfamily protein PflX
MTGSYHQKRDLRQFGEQVRRLLITRIITARNVDKISDEQMKFLETLLPTAADIELLLDQYTPSVDVTKALAEIEPLVATMQAAQTQAEHADFRAMAIQLRAWRSRVNAAINYLRADPR